MHGRRHQASFCLAHRNATSTVYANVVYSLFHKHKASNVRFLGRCQCQEGLSGINEIISANNRNFWVLTHHVQALKLNWSVDKRKHCAHIVAKQSITSYSKHWWSLGWYILHGANKHLGQRSWKIGTKRKQLPCSERRKPVVDCRVVNCDESWRIESKGGVIG